MTKWTTKELPEVGYLVRWHLQNEAVMNFQVCECVGSVHVDDKPAVVVIDGMIKWDGCMDVTFCNQDCGESLHFCSRNDATNMAKAIDAVYDLASEMLTNWEGG